MIVLFAPGCAGVTFAIAFALICIGFVLWLRLSSLLPAIIFAGLGMICGWAIVDGKLYKLIQWVTENRAGYISEKVYPDLNVTEYETNTVMTIAPNKRSGSFDRVDFGKLRDRGIIQQMCKLLVELDGEFSGPDFNSQFNPTPFEAFRSGFVRAHLAYTTGNRHNPGYHANAAGLHYAQRWAVGSVENAGRMIL